MLDHVGSRLIFFLLVVVIIFFFFIVLSVVSYIFRRVVAGRSQPPFRPSWIIAGKKYSTPKTIYDRKYC